MKTINIPFLILLSFYLSSQVIYPQTDSLKPDYRNHINIPEYNKTLIPLQKVSTNSGTWTELNPKVPRVDYLGVDFVDSLNGWTVGANGVILKTTDGGKKWNIIQSGLANILTHVNSYNGNVVIAVSMGGKIIRSSDKGESWAEIASGTTRDLWRVQMLNDTLGWISGTVSTLLKTTDGGLSWQSVFTGFPQNYWSLSFLNENVGYICCSNGYILKTTDGGSNWQQQNVGDDYPLYCITVLDTQTIVTGGFGRIATSYNGGNNWSITGLGGIFYCLAFRDSLYGIALNTMGSHYYQTTDKGVSWEMVDTYRFANNWADFINNKLAVAVGDGLNLQKTTDGGNVWKQLILNDDFNDVFFINESKGFAISFYSLYQTFDGGINWQKKETAPGGYDILFLDSTVGFICGSQVLYKTVDGGENWYPTNTLGLNTSKVFFINNQIGWALSSGKILKTIDGGENWFIQLQVLDGFTSIYFIDSLNGWATSRYVWQTTDGGENWIERTDIPAFFCDDVFFSDYFRGWIIAGNELYSTSNGGSSWTPDPQVYTYSRNFETISNTHFIITGTNIYESTDTGHVWQNITNITGGYFTGLHAPKNYIAYAVGTGGFIVRYFDSLIVPVELSQFFADLKENMSVQLQWVTESEKNNLGFEVFRSADLLNWNKIGFVTGIGTSVSKSTYTFIDNDFFGSKVYYRLKQIDYNGYYSLSKIVTVEFYVMDYYLYQNYPNPANPSTYITFTIPQSTRIKIELYSITGEKVKEILDDEKEKGIYKTNINLNDFSSGVYFYTMRTNNGYSAIKKLILIK